MLLAAVLSGTARVASGAAPALLDELVVSRGVLTAGELRLRCAVGRGGVRRDKVEGDGATPAGRFALRLVLFRPDRVAGVETALPARALSPADGWCDDAAAPRYNTLITLPSSAHHEELWRADHLYDVIAVIGYNDAPVIAGKGSAIFLHVASPDFAATDGCVALALPALLTVLRRCGPMTAIKVEA
ncbi:MAG TPA: L,D-transpeptidase family protein [Acidisphaera sp.]|nr:L,D-transpeptidase family protein [Acidisphaera sp.]